MSNLNIQNRVSEFEIGWFSVVMVGLVVLIQGLAIVVAPHLSEFITLPDTQASEGSIGVMMAGVVVVESVVIVGLYRLWKRLPDYLRKYGKYALMALMYGASGWLSYQAGAFRTFIGLTAFLGFWIIVSRTLKHFDMDWMAFNLFSIGLGIGATAFIGVVALPVVIIPLMVALLVWDHVAVNLSDMMGDLIEFSSSAGLPNVIIIPTGLSLDSEKTKEYLKDPESEERPQNLLAMIGVGDFSIPGALTVSAWVAGFETVAVTSLLGTCIAMAILYNSLQKSDSGLPALPWLNTGAITGFGIGILVAGVPVLVALGVASA